MPTYNRQAFNAELERDEGRRYYPYKDSLGIETVGVGHNLAVAPLPGQTYPMSDSTVSALRDADIASTEKKLDTYLPWWRTLDDVRQRVMLNMCFNLGIGRPGNGQGLLSFGTFLGLVQKGDYAAASRDLTGTLWHRQVGQRAVRLEAMLETGSAAAPASPAPPYRPSPAPAPLPKPSAAPAGIWQAVLAILNAILAFFNRKV